MYARNSFENVLKKDYQKTLKIFCFFPMHAVSFYGQVYEKQKRPGTSYWSLFGLQNLFQGILSSRKMVGQFHWILGQLSKFKY